MRNLMIIGMLVFSTTLLAAGNLVTQKLSPETRSVLIQEMQAIAAAMGRIHTAMVTGDHATVAREAGNIEASFVLKQKLTQEQRHEIHARLPEQFIAADKAFHELAGKLAESARQESTRGERSAFAAMSESCVACHARFAAKRFPLNVPAGE